ASVDQCEKREVKGVDYYFAVIEQKGGETAAALPSIIIDAIFALPWPKSMRWGDDRRFSWVRPLHNILCVFDRKTVDFEFLRGVGSAQVGRDLTVASDDPNASVAIHKLRSNNLTYGHRFLAPGFVEVSDAKTYRERLKRVFVVADAAERKELIRQEAKALAA